MLTDLEPKAASREAFTRADAERVLACGDLVSVGVLAEAARRAAHADRVSFVQVLDGAALSQAADVEFGEVRLTAPIPSWTAGAGLVTAARAVSRGRPVTGFTAEALLALAGGDHLALADGARQLREAGLTAVAALAIDETDDPGAVVRALAHAGLPVWRVVVRRPAPVERRLDLIERVAALQAATGALRAFAPLPIEDPVDVPSTGYDDVRTIAVARLMCPSVPSIQVDWAQYGPKLAQVALAYGADDLDNVPAVDDLGLGRRRSPREEIERQIEAAFATPVARDGAFEPLR